jgi:hypothetical protein
LEGFVGARAVRQNRGRAVLFDPGSGGESREGEPEFFQKCMALRVLEGRAMMDVALSLLALIAGGVTLELFSTALPPQVRSDDVGFRLVSPAFEAAEELQAGNPS